MQGQVWNDLLSISSHELFHLWNVKRIRPADMVPYDYSREQYSRLHDITEGFTTYYGELMLVRPGVWSLDEWLKEMNDILQKHLEAPGKAYTSLTDASFNSWINGYHNEGLAELKISFYHKGALTAMLLDLRLRQHTDGKHSLDNLMQRLYADYKTPDYTGYTREDIQAHLKALGFVDADAFYHDFVAGNADVLAALQSILPSFGLQLNAIPGSSFTRHTLGLRMVRNTDNKLMVTEVLPGSPAAESSLHPGDILHALDGIELASEDPDTDFQYACTLKDSITITYTTRGIRRSTYLQNSSQRFDTTYAFSALPEADGEVLKRRQDWLGC
jgi:predicted metalloprotease with PDZ domain